MARYAATTKVTPEQSRVEIERILTRYGADQFAYGWNGDHAMVGFRAHDRQVRFVLAMPDRDANEFNYTPERRLKRSPADAERAWEQARLQQWRALVLVIKAKLEAVESGIVTFEEEFLAQIVLPNGQTTGEWLGPQIEDAYDSGDMPSLLPGMAPQLTSGD